MVKPISVLIVDDSALIRNLVSRMFEDVPDIMVAGTAMNGIFALRKIATLNPDVIILDLEMPEMNGIEFLKERKRRKIEVPVVILSSLARRGARITMEALDLGAAEFILKPSEANEQDLKNTRNQLLQLVRFFGSRYKRGEGRGEDRRQEEQKVRRPAAPLPEKVAPKRSPGPIELIAIGVSTGGPKALREIIPKLKKDLPAPIAVVQHMPAGFTEEFADSLDRISPLEIREAEDGDLLKQGRVLIAPGNRHMSVEARPLANTVRLSDSAPVNGHRPSVDVLFQSVAKTYANKCLAIIMTGMGKDGAAEIGSIYREGGLTLAQDEASSVVFGMPRVAIEQGYIHRVIPLAKMAEVINSLARENP